MNFGINAAMQIAYKEIHLLFGIKRLKDMPEVRKRAQEVLAGLSKGLI